MIQLIPKTNIDFVGKRYICFAISGALLLSGIVSLIVKGGPKWGLDFTGGTLIEIQFQKPQKLEEVRKALSDKKIETFEIQTVSGENTYIIRTALFSSNSSNQSEAVSTGTVSMSTSVIQAAADKSEGQDAGLQIQSALQGSFPDNPIMVLRKEFVGPTVGKHLIKQTSLAFLLTFAGIIIYVAFRFHSPVWGASGVIAIIHDVSATIGIFSILDKEITITIVAALLTIAGYSINDTIVIFDFMRERMRFRRTESLAELINLSINSTLSRTVITNLMVFTVVLMLFFFGGEVIHDFAFAMVFGAIVGTYSTVAIAAPIIFEWDMIRTKRNNNNNIKKK